MTNVWDQHKDKLSGGWKCISYEMFDGDGPSKKLLAKPHGDVPLGRAIITPKGFLSAHLANPNRLKPLKSSSEWTSGSDEELAFVARGLSMYAGYLQLFEDEAGELYWETKVEICSDPNRMGGLQVRKVQLFEEGGKSYMVLKPKQDMVMEVSLEMKGCGDLC